MVSHLMQNGLTTKHMDPKDRFKHSLSRMIQIKNPVI